jgi:hypothetical protein
MSDEKQLPKVYITKYAISRGIIEDDATYLSANNPPVVGEIKRCTIVNKKNLPSYTFYGDDFFVTREEAVQFAEKVKRRKIKNLRNRIKKLESKKFE